MRWLSVCLLVALALAGCTDEAAPEPADDPRFAGIDDVAAGHGVIRGVVVDETITPIEGATLRLCNGEGTTESDADGAFVFKDLEPGLTCVLASKPGYGSVQQSTQVEADETAPPVMRIQLVSAPGTEPRAFTLQQEAYLECNIGEPTDDHDCGTEQDDPGQMRFPLEEQPDWIQVELMWESTQPAGENLYVILELCDGCDPGTTDSVDGAPGRWYEEGDATSILVSRTGPDFIGGVWNLTDAHEVLVDVSAGDITPVGPGITLGQDVQAFVTFFYNIEPAEDWTFTSDGDYPL